jgi:hypothetical protein
MSTKRNVPKYNRPEVQNIKTAKVKVNDDQ